MRAAAPLILIWIGLHAAVLMGLLAIKFLGLKLVMLTMLVLGTVWYLTRQPARLLPARIAVNPSSARGR